MSKKDQLENLNMFWEGKYDFNIPVAKSVEFALFVFEKNLASITWNNMSSLEKNPATLPQTETILHGQSVTGIKIEELLQVKRYGDTAKKLIQLIKNNNFKVDTKTAFELHAVAGKDEALTFGEFRKSIVTIQGVNNYVPPGAEKLEDIAKKGFKYLNEKDISPPEKAFATFLFMSRSQFFYDVNKRTASLMMNGILLSNSYYPIVINNKNSEEFHTKLSDFYNTGNATSMMTFFDESTKKLYPAS